MKAFVTAAFHPDALARLERLMVVQYEDWRKEQKIYFDGAEFARRLNDARADVVIVEADLVHQDVLDRCHLQLIGCCRGDPINVGSERATELGIPVLFTPARNADAVADLTLAFMLALARNVLTVTSLLRSGEMRFSSTKDYLGVYEKYGGFELGGITVGIVGMGAIGKGVARRLRGFGTRIVAYDPLVPSDVMAQHDVEAVSLQELLERSEMVTVHCPALPETYDLIGAAEIARMKPGAYLLNLARAQIVNEDALYAALTNGHLGGAALDVVRDEPLQPENRFVALPNVLVAPHLGGATRDVVRHQSEMIVADIEALWRGDRPTYIVNPAVLAASPPFWIPKTQT